MSRIIQAEARAAGRGLWAGDFENPARWRREHPRDAR
jgi:endonuclease YncB( thermonuclease family)